MPSFLDEYDIKKIALLAVFVLAAIGVIYLLTAWPFTIPSLLPTGEPIPADCIDENKAKQDQCIVSKSLELKQPSLCDVVSIERKETCLSFNYLALDKPDSCESLSQEGKESCYSLFAREKQDNSYCEKIIDANVHDVCIFTSSQLSNETCGLMQLTERKDSCLNLTAVKENDLSICNKIVDANISDACVLTLSLPVTSPDTCFNLKTEGMKSSCFYSLATATSDANFCDFIKLDELKISCNQTITEKTEETP